jgi:hypothetical protein
MTPVLERPAFINKEVFALFEFDDPKSCRQPDGSYPPWSVDRELKALTTFASYWAGLIPGGKTSALPTPGTL